MVKMTDAYIDELEKRHGISDETQELRQRYGTPVTPNLPMQMDSLLPPKSIEESVKEEYAIASSQGVTLDEARVINQQKSWRRAVGDAIKSGSIRSAAAVAHLPKHLMIQAEKVSRRVRKVSKETGRRPYGFGPTFSDYQSILDMTDEQVDTLLEKTSIQNPDSSINKVLDHSSEWVSGGLRKVLEDHPEWQKERHENFVDLISNPKKLVPAIVESIPMLVSAGILTTTGHPIAAYSVVYAIEGEESYQEAIADGQSEATAENARMLYGTVAAALEMSQISLGIKLAKELWKPIRNRIAKTVVQRGLAKALSYKVLKTLFVENTQEWAQGTWQEATAKLLYGKKQEGGLAGFVDRRLQESAVITPLTLTTGGVGAAAGAVSGTAKKGGPPTAPKEKAEAKPADKVAPEAPITEKPAGLAEREIYELKEEEAPISRETRMVLQSKGYTLDEIGRLSPDEAIAVEKGAQPRAMPGEVAEPSTDITGERVSIAESARKSWKRLTDMPEWALREVWGEKIPEKLTVYHAGKGKVRPGVFVTTNPTYAREFLEEGETISVKENVPISDLKAMGEGRIIGVNRHTKSEGIELIYDPKARPPAAPTDEAATTAESVSPEAVPVVKKLVTGLREAGKDKKALKEFRKSKSKELGRRTAIYAKFVMQKLKEGLSPLAAHRAARGALKGVLADRPRFQPPALTDTEWITLENDIQNKPYEKYPLWQDNCLEALNMVREGTVPARYQIAMLEQQFGREFAEALLDMLPFDTWDTISQLVGLPRATLSSGDISGIARQGRLLAGTYPVEGAAMAKASVVAFASEEKAVELDKEMRQDDDYAFWKDNDLELPGFAEATEEYEKEERFPTGGIAEKIPLVRRSERSFTVGLNTLRFGVAKRLRTIWEAEHGKGISRKAAKQIAGWINAASGRAGRTQHNALKQLSMLLNKIMFSPRFALSRITAPARLLAFHNPIVMRSAWRSFATMEGTNTMILGLAAMAGATVALDPRSSDFKKVKTGSLRLDLNAGFQQPLRFLQQMIKPETKTEAGKVRDIGRAEAISRFARSKQAPWSGLIWDILENRNWAGEPLGKLSHGFADKLAQAVPFRSFFGLFPLMTEKNAQKIEDALGKYPTVVGISKEAYQRVVYLALQGITDAALEEGWPTALLAMTEIMGVSTQAYPKRASIELQQLQNKLSQDTYGQKWDDLTESQQHEMRDEHPEFIDYETRIAQERMQRTPSQEVFPTAEEAKVREEIQKRMPEGIADELFSIGLRPSGISRTLYKDKKPFFLNDKRYERYQGLVVEEMGEALMELFNDEGYLDAEIAEQRTEAAKVMSKAKDRARQRLREEIEGE